MSDILSKIIKGVAAVAPTVANLALPGSGMLVHSLMRTVTGDGEDTPIADVAAKIEADPALFVELKRVAADREIRLRELGSKDLETVNLTMQAESKSEHWPQWSWRPYNGFLFGTAVVLIYFLLPLLGKTVPEVPQWIWIGWGAILGVTTWGRGKEKRAKAVEESAGLGQRIGGFFNAVRGKP